MVFGWPNPACLRYRLTNRRVLVEQPFGGGEQQSVSLDRFDTVTLEVLPGQEWYPAGDLIFRNGPIETFRLSGVPHPEGFRHTCLKGAAVPLRRAAGPRGGHGGVSRRLLTEVPRKFL